MTLQTFIEDTLPALGITLRDHDCDHILISSQGSWSARVHGTWHTQPRQLDPKTVAVLIEMCAQTPDDNVVPPFGINLLTHPTHTTIAMERLPARLPLTLPNSLMETLRRALQRGENGLILGPPSSPKEGLLARIATLFTSSPSLYVTSRAIPAASPHTLLVSPPESPDTLRHLRASMRLMSAAFWEDVRSPAHLDELLGFPGCTRRWGTIDALDPDASLEHLSRRVLMIPAQDLHHIIWVEPYYHGDVPPIVLERHDDLWRSSSTSALANMLLESANRHLPCVQAAPSSPQPLSPTHTSAHAHANRIPTSLFEIDRALNSPLESAIDRIGFSELLQTHVTPDNHLLSTHPGFGSRSTIEDSDAEIVPSSLELHTSTLQVATPSSVIEDHVIKEDSTHISLDDISEDPVLFDDFVDFEPEIIEESFAELDAHALPGDPLAVTMALPPESDDSPTMVALDELAHDEGGEHGAQTVPISRSTLATHYGELMAPQHDMEDATELISAPYDELKRMERELMIASHDEPTGIHPDFLDPPKISEPSNEDHITTSVKGPSEMTLPDDPEVFSSLNSHASPRDIPSAPAGLWQPAVADEPTQISFEHTHFAAEMTDLHEPNLSWDDDEHTIQRKQNEAATPPEHPGATDTSSKLSTLSDRIKALREKQRLSGQFDAIDPHEDF